LHWPCNFAACRSAVDLGHSLVVIMPTRLQSALMTAAAVLLVLLGAYAAGSRAARRAEELKQARSRSATMRKAHDVKQTLDALNDDAMRRRAAKWVRGK